MKIDKGVIYDAFSDICIVVNHNVEYNSKAHIDIHQAIKNASDRILKHLNI